MDQARLSGKLPIFALLLVLGQAVLAQTGHTLPLVMSGFQPGPAGLGSHHQSLGARRHGGHRRD